MAAVLTSNSIMFDETSSRSGTRLSRVKRRLAIHYLAAARLELRGERSLDEDWPRIQRIWDWLVDNASENELLVGYALAFDSRQDRVGLWRESIKRHQIAAISAHTIGRGHDEAIILNNLGLAYARLGEVRHAIESYERALATYRELGYRDGEANVLCNLGTAYHRIGDLQRAGGFYQECLDISREGENPRAEANSLNNIALLLTWTASFWLKRSKIERDSQSR